METDQILILVSIVAVVALIYAFTQRKNQSESEKKLSEIKSENKKLNEQVEHYKKLESKDNKKDNAKKESKESTAKTSEEFAELKENNKALKAEIAKLKERNYSLDQDNKSLRKDIKENNESSTAEQKEIVTLREANNDLNASLNASNAKVTALTKELEEAKQSIVNAAPVAVEKTDNAELSSALKRNETLEASLKDVKGELASYKKDFKAEVDAAKKEVAESNRSLRKDLSKSERQMQQSKKRAENSRILYLVARSQMMLAEKRLATLDPNFKPTLLPTSSDAIDEAVKKFMTATAREANSLQKLNNKIKELEAENQALKAPKEIDKNEISLSGLEDDESIDDMVSTLSEQTQATEQKHETPSVNLNNEPPKDLDLSNIDGDDWETI